MMRPLGLAAAVAFAIMTFTGPVWATETSAPDVTVSPKLSAGGPSVLGAAGKIKVQKSIVLADRRRRRHRHRNAGRIMGGIAAGVAAAIIAKELARSGYGGYDHEEQRCEQLESRCDEGSRSACRRYDTYCD
jgi:hypothetical protein